MMTIVKLLGVCGMLLYAQPAWAMLNMTDAITVTSATTGKVIVEGTVNIASLSAAQKTALVAFITSLGGSWPGNASHITSVNVYRTPQIPNTIGCQVTGLVVLNDAATAVAQQTSGAINHIIGIVP